jgi:hypothetical protein
MKAMFFEHEGPAFAKASAWQARSYTKGKSKSFKAMILPRRTPFSRQRIRRNLKSGEKSVSSKSGKLFLSQRRRDAEKFKDL